MAGIVLKTGGTEENQGTILGTAYGVEIYGGVGTVLNSGYIQASALGGAGVLLKNGGSVTNSQGGSISGNTAVSLLDGGTVTNAFGAQIVSYFPSANAVAINITGAVGHVSNSGSIVTQSVASTFAAVFLGDGGDVNNDATGVIKTGAFESAISILGGAGQVTNAGTISAGAYAVSLSAGGTLSNSGGIYGRVAISGNDGSVTNSGTIFAAGSPTGATSGIGVSVGSGGGVTNEAGGSIGGGGADGVGIAVYGGGAIVNAGTISGSEAAVQFSGAGANSLTLQTGSVLNGAAMGSTSQGATNTLVLAGSGVANNTFVDFDTLTMQTTGQWTLGGVSTFGVANVSMGTLAITGVLTAALNETTNVRIGMGGKLKLNGASSLSGVTSGLGTLAIKAGMTTIASGAELSVAHWSIVGATARATINETLVYSGAFTAGMGAVVAVSTGPFTLSGTAVFAGVKITGPQRVKDRAATTVTGLIIGGTGGFANKGALSQSGGVVLGDLTGGATTLFNSAGATWNITADSGVSLGASPVSQIVNFGQFGKSGGTGVSVIAPAFDNEASVSVASGVLDFQSDVTGLGVETIFGAATLEFDANVASKQKIVFQGAGGVLDLGAPSSFFGVISGFDTIGVSDALQLLGSWTLSGYSQSNATQGVLSLSNGAETVTLAFDGNYKPGAFSASATSGHTTITYG